MKLANSVAADATGPSQLSRLKGLLSCTTSADPALAFAIRNRSSQGRKCSDVLTQKRPFRVYPEVNAEAAKKTNEKIFPKFKLAFNNVGDVGESSSIINTGHDDNGMESSLLTPQTYAASEVAEQKVEETITDKASIAFAATNFDQEPQLCPELENVEAAYESAMIANAAHALADAAEKESKQSMAAMLEREKEMEWIEKHEDSNAPYFLSPRVSITDKKVQAERNQRALLQARLIMEKKAKDAAARAKALRDEMNQRALLEARLMLEKKSKEAAYAIEQRSDWMESEALAASMGAHEFTVGLASVAAASATVHASGTKECEGEKTPANQNPAAKLAATAERMIMGDDIAFDIALIEDAEEHSVDAERNTQHEENNGKGPAQKETLSGLNQWRQDYIQEIRSYVQKKGIEQTKSKLSRKVGATGQGDHTSVDANNTDNASVSIASLHSGNNAVKRALEHGLIRRMRQRRRLIFAALVVVMSRRLVLAWFGNAMRLL
ncbi:hypothetical protein HJC23_004004 [Cyclotella cryptica]|uniref:Uncharacterized protein n=1 Tax=Cyclotella cryptica TaxID=29204 RepID=A0ABD3QUK3_9STRA